MDTASGLRDEHEAPRDPVNGAEVGTALERGAASIAHDLNNLLTIVIGFAEQIEGSTTAGSGTGTAARLILGAAERAGRLIQELGVLSREEAGLQTAVDVDAVIDDLRELLTHAVGDGVALEVRSSGRLPSVMVDRVQVDRVLLNLAVNAREAMPGGGTVTIQTDAVEIGADGSSMHERLRPGPHVRIAVTDSGTGMAADVAAHALESYFTTKLPSAGTGLGLSTVRALAESTGGAVDLRTEPGVGTTVIVLLPAMGSSAARAR